MSPRCTAIVADVCGLSAATAVSNCDVFDTGVLATFTTTSPGRMPPALAGPSCSTPVIRTPSLIGRLKVSAISGVRSRGSTPIQPRVTWPSLTRPSITSLAVLTGIAKPMPRLPPVREKIAVLMPSRLPLASTSAPPELPGLMAASVWMKFSKVLMPSWLRPSALTIPEVTVWPTPNGLPIASTTSPTWSASVSPKVIAGSRSRLIFSTATSVSGSAPTTLARALRPSASSTSISSAPSITWLLVSK